MISSSSGLGAAQVQMAAATDALKKADASQAGALALLQDTAPVNAAVQSGANLHPLKGHNVDFSA